MQSNTLKQYTAAIVAATAIIGAANAATISWSFSEIVSTGGAGSVMGTGFLDNYETFVYAENTGGAAVANFDGISFGAGTIDLGESNAVFHSSGTQITHSATSGSSGADTTTIGFGGVGSDLVLGTTYRIQLIAMDGRGDFSARTFEVDGNVTDHTLGTSGSTWGNALLATGTFIADGSSQTFTTEVFDGATSKGGHINGLILHSVAVPEPSSTALLGLGGLALILRRRK